MWQPTIYILMASSVFMLVYYGTHWFIMMFHRQMRWYERVLVNQLLIDIKPRLAVWLSIGLVLVTGLIGFLIADSFLFFLIGCALGAGLPNLLVRHLEQRRAEKLELQLVDGITTLASGVRAGLNLVQSMELLIKNSTGPIKQEFAQMLREYQMGLDLNQAMHNAADRIASPNYRLLFTAIEMHRQRGGDTGESLDRICESIREIQRLEGKLDAITAQGRSQAWMMAAMPVLFFLLLYAIDREGVYLLITEPLGRILLFAAIGLMAIAFWWIRRIMSVEI